MNRLVLISALLALAACGVGTPPRAMTSSQALAQTAESLEFVAPATRQELYRDVVRHSIAQQGQVGSTVLFPFMQDGELQGAVALDARADLLQAPDAGVLQLTFDTRGDRFSEDRRDAFQGLSEKEATELVARSLLHRWNVKSTGPVLVIRAAGAPYAAAWIDGALRINPAFVYMAAAPAAPAN